MGHAGKGWSEGDIVSTWYISLTFVGISGRETPERNFGSTYVREIAARTKMEKKSAKCIMTVICGGSVWLDCLSDVFVELLVEIGRFVPQGIGYIGYSFLFPLNKTRFNSTFDVIGMVNVNWEWWFTNSMVQNGPKRGTAYLTFVSSHIFGFELIFILVFSSLFEWYINCMMLVLDLLLYEVMAAALESNLVSWYGEDQNTGTYQGMNDCYGKEKALQI